jgi:hypothetical protein
VRIAQYLALLADAAVAPVIVRGAGKQSWNDALGRDEGVGGMGGNQPETQSRKKPAVSAETERLRAILIDHLKRQPGAAAAAHSGSLFKPLSAAAREASPE